METGCIPKDEDTILGSNICLIIVTIRIPYN